MSWQGKRVLVTGGAGFIGSHLAERLVELGASVRVLSHYRSDGGHGWLDSADLADQVEVIAGDITDPDNVRQAMIGREVVFHLAARIAIPDSYGSPATHLSVNLGGTFNVLNAARHMERPPLIVHTSTSETLGTAQYVPMDEAHPCGPQSPYAASKAAADNLVAAFHRSYGLPTVTLRCFNTFGPRQSARAIVPTIISQCLAGGPVRLGNLYPTRDLNYVADTVEGFIAAAECEAAVGRVVNIGSGREISIGELALKIAAMVGGPTLIESDGQRLRPATSEVDRLLCDNRLARELLGWQPRYTLEQGLSATIEWMEEHRDSYRPAAYAV